MRRISSHDPIRGAEENGNDEADVKPGRILVVDDEELIRRILTEMLSEQGYAVTTASDGEQAVELLEQQTLDLVMTDLVMPGLDGIEVLRAARRTTPVPGNFDDRLLLGEAVARLVREGVANYIAKPFDIQFVIDTVAGLIEPRKGTSA